jgi:hypothetical protein
MADSSTSAARGDRPAARQAPAASSARAAARAAAATSSLQPSATCVRRQGLRTALCMPRSSPSWRSGRNRVASATASARRAAQSSAGTAPRTRSTPVVCIALDARRRSVLMLCARIIVGAASRSSQAQRLTGLGEHASARDQKATMAY